MGSSTYLSLVSLSAFLDCNRVYACEFRMDRLQICQLDNQHSLRVKHTNAIARTSRRFFKHIIWSFPKHTSGTTYASAICNAIIFKTYIFVARRADVGRRVGYQTHYLTIVKTYQRDDVGLPERDGQRDNFQSWLIFVASVVAPVFAPHKSSWSSRWSSRCNVWTVTRFSHLSSRHSSRHLSRHSSRA